MALYFRRKKSDRRTDAALKLTRQARDILDVGDDTAVSIGEHDCGEPECCGTRTVVLVLRPGHPTKAIQIEKPIESVTRADLFEALAPFAALACAPKTRSRTI